MTIDITQIVVAVIGLLSAVLTAFIVPWIKSKTSISQQSIIETLARSAVCAAQQIFGTDEGQQKKEYAVHRVEEALKAYGIKIDADRISEAIEAALKAVKLESNGEWRSANGNLNEQG